MAGNLGTQRSDLSDMVRATIDTVLLDLNVCLPGKVVTYDKATQFADVEIQLTQTYLDGSKPKYPVIPNVPVKWPRANDGAAFIHLPLTVGDDVILVFSQRSLDNWKQQGGMTDPDDARKHHITDAYALVGGSAMPDAFTPTTDDSIEIMNGETAVVVHPDGKFSATNNTAELVDTLDKILIQVKLTNTTLGSDTTNTLFGPQQLLAFETYQQIAQALGQLQTKLESFLVTDAS